MIGIVCAFFHTEGKGFYSSRQLRLYSRGSADPRESLRKCRISKFALTAHKVLFTQGIPVQPLFVSRELFVGGNQWGRRVVAFFSGLADCGNDFSDTL